ncbi:hypothetical protein CC86DRAFT_377273 [Ophiobolus disseminans]|uniref:Uncharacterized protein n=1 Tax=Ophiobolus disseminans TaxID=1469910 RepID=A0A6A7AFK3_9PLEO|nr:hypothetical protein CC86DRAFT_377273 [Ophiobolus disseminans]
MPCTNEMSSGITVVGCRPASWAIDRSHPPSPSGRAAATKLSRPGTPAANRILKVTVPWLFRGRRVAASVHKSRLQHHDGHSSRHPPQAEWQRDELAAGDLKPIRPIDRGDSCPREGDPVPGPLLTSVACFKTISSPYKTRRLPVCDMTMPSHQPALAALAIRCHTRPSQRQHHRGQIWRPVDAPSLAVQRCPHHVHDCVHHSTVVRLTSVMSPAAAAKADTLNIAITCGRAAKRLDRRPARRWNTAMMQRDVAR